MLEGVMMRSPHCSIVGVRDPQGNSNETKPLCQLDF